MVHTSKCFENHQDQVPISCHHPSPCGEYSWTCIGSWLHHQTRPTDPLNKRKGPFDPLDLSQPSILSSEYSCRSRREMTKKICSYLQISRYNNDCVKHHDVTTSTVGWLVLPYRTAHLTLSSVKLCLPLSKTDCFCALWKETFLQSLMQRAGHLLVYVQ